MAYLATILVAKFRQVVRTHCDRLVDEARPVKPSQSHLSLNCGVQSGREQNLVYSVVDNFLGVFELHRYKGSDEFFE